MNWKGCLEVIYELERMSRGYYIKNWKGCLEVIYELERMSRGYI